MRLLYLLRHCKSDWTEPVTDHDRPLAARGRRAGALIAAHLAAASIRPELVLCSSARRTRETLAAVVPELGEATTIRIERGLYGAGAPDLCVRVRAVDDAFTSVMLIGHNPGIEELALGLAGDGDPAAMARLETKYPTGGLATLAVAAGSWQDLGPGTCALRAFVVPRELEYARSR